MWFWVGVSVLVIVLVILEQWNSYHFRSLSVLPFPQNIWPIGNGYAFSGSRITSLNGLREFRKKYGTLIRTKLFCLHGIIVSDVVVAERLLSNANLLRKGEIYKYLRPWLGTGLLTATGSKWKAHRKLITPAFHFNILPQFMSVFNTQSDKLVEALKQHHTDNPIDITNFITLCTLDIICESAMNISINAQSKGDSDYVKSVKNMKEVIFKRIGTGYKHFDFIFNLFPESKLQDKSLSIIKCLSKSTITRRREELMKMNLNLDDISTGIRGKFAFLDLLLLSTKDGQPLTDDEIQEEVDTFMFEGHDTVTSAISFCLYNISKHMGVQDKLLQEIHSVLSMNCSEITYNQLQQLKYMELVIKETMRLYPPVPVISRKTEEVIDVGAVVIPKRTGVFFDIFSMHRDPELYENPLEFIPERFTIENSQSRSPFAYVPFSAGVRNCIGQKFAMLEMKSVIAKVLLNFELSQDALPHVVNMRYTSILFSENGIKVKLRKRTN